MLEKYKKEAETELKLTKEQLRRERDSEIEKLIVKMSEEQAGWKKENELKNIENEKTIRLKYLDELKGMKKVELDLKEQAEHVKIVKNSLEAKVDELNRKILKYEEEKQIWRDTKFKDERRHKEELETTKASLLKLEALIKQSESEWLRKHNRIELEVEDLRELNKKLREDHASALESLNRDHQQELETIEQTVRKTVDKKNQMIEGLRTQLKEEIEERENLKSKFERHRTNLVNALE